MSQTKREKLEELLNLFETWHLLNDNMYFAGAASGVKGALKILDGDDEELIEARDGVALAKEALAKRRTMQ